MSTIVAVSLLGTLGVGRAQIDALRGRKVVAVDLKAAASIDRKELRGVLPVHVGEVLEADPCDAVEKRVLATEVYSEVRCELVPRNDGVVVVVHLVRRSIVNLIRFYGNSVIGREQLRRAIRLQEGGPFNAELQSNALDRLRTFYADEGFDEAGVTVEIEELAPGEINVGFHIEEGEPRRVSAIDIVGPTPLAPEKIREATGVSVGDRYRRAIQRTAESTVKVALRAASYLEADADVSWEPLPPRGGRVRVEVDPGPLVDVQFLGNEKFDDARLLGLMDLQSRVVVTDGTWRELRRRIRRRYQEAGYYRVKVDVQIEPGPPKVIRYAIEEGESYRIATVKLDGDVGVGADELRRVMVTGPPTWVPWRAGVFLDDELAEDLKRLWFLYRRLGFQAAEIADYRIDVDAAHHTLDVAVVMAAGRRTITRSVGFDGFEALGGVLPPLSTREGEPLNPEAVEGDRQALAAALALQGFAHASVEAQVDSAVEGETEGAVVRFVGDPRVQQRIGHIIVQNNIDTRASVIRRELSFKEGDLLSPEALLAGQGNIYRLGLFRSVTVQPLGADETAATRDVAVSVFEKLPATVQVGAGYNTRDGIRGFVELAHNNLQGRGRRLSLRGDLSFDPTNQAAPNEYLLNLGFREAHAAGTQWNVRTNWIAQRATRSIDQFSLERLAFVPAIERSLLPGLQAGLELQLEDARIFDVKPDVLVFNRRDQERLRSFSLGPFLVYDDRDDPFAPHRGMFDTVRIRYASKELGSDVPFMKLQAQHSHYVPLTKDLTFVYAARVGWARALEGGEQVPLRERFFLGGRTTVRGFAESSIGPQGAPIIDQLGRVQNSGGNPIGGDLAVNVNTELRFPLLYGVGGSVFVDTGGLYLQDRRMRLDDLRRSAGLGLSYATPVGPIGLDYGFKLDRRRDESIGEIHFTIGTIF